MIDTATHYTDGRPAGAPQTYWTDVGALYSATAAQKTMIAHKIEGLDWQPVVPGMRVPFSQGYALRAIMRSMPGTHRRIAWNGAIGPIGFYGVESVYDTGVGRAYYVDDGTEVQAVRSDYWPNSPA